MLRAFLVLFFIIPLAHLAIGQDSLSGKTFKELDKLSVDAFEEGNIELSRVYSTYQIALAKKQKDSVRIAFSFYTYMFDENLELALKYCDSAIFYTKNSKHNSHPTYGYLVKSRRLIENGKFDDAMVNLVTAYNYAKEKKNEDHISTAKQKMARVKSYLGDYQEALKLYREDYQYILKKDPKARNIDDYEIVIYNLAIIFLKNRMLDSARHYSNLGLKKSKLGSYRYHKFVGVNAEIDYYSNNFDASLDSLLQYLDKYKGNSLANKFYYIGKIYEIKQEFNLAKSYLKKVDSIVISDQEPFDEVKDVYQTLAEFYRKEQNDSLQIVYINKYIWADSILNHQKKQINPLMVLKFDNPRMLAEKQHLIEIAEGKNKLLYIITTIAFLVIIIGTILYRNQINLKRKLKTLVKEGVHLEFSKKKMNNLVELKVPENIVIDIRQRLELFEKSKLVNEIRLNQTILANNIDTNSTYLSNYINHFKGQNFPSYLKELRIKIAVDRMKSEPNLLKYSIKGLASEFGFATSNAFSRAFVKYTGIRASKFLEELIKNKDK